MERVSHQPVYNLILPGGKEIEKQKNRQEFSLKNQRKALGRIRSRTEPITGYSVN